MPCKNLQLFDVMQNLANSTTGVEVPFEENMSMQILGDLNEVYTLSLSDFPTPVGCPYYSPLFFIGPVWQHKTFFCMQVFQSLTILQYLMEWFIEGVPQLLWVTVPVPVLEQDSSGTWVGMQGSC